jgi:hypothetical protein
MLKAIVVITVPLIGLLLASGGASVAIAPAAPDASNIGFVLYTKSYARHLMIVCRLTRACSRQAVVGQSSAAGATLLVAKQWKR